MPNGILKHTEPSRCKLYSVHMHVFRNVCSYLYILFVYICTLYAVQRQRYLDFFRSRRDQSCVVYVCYACVYVYIRMNLTTCVFTHHKTAMCHFPFYILLYIITFLLIRAFVQNPVFLPPIDSTP